MASLMQLALLASALAIVAAQGGGSYDCDAGCPLLASAPVCGANGVTFANGCLAVCSGTTVDYEGACLAKAKRSRSSSSSTSRSSASSTPAGGSLQDHPVAQLLLTGSEGTNVPAGTEAPAAAGRVATASDMARYAAEGLSLVGAARLGSFKPEKKPDDKNAGLLSDPRVARKRMELFAVRVMHETGFVYSSAPSLATGRAARGGAGASLRLPSVAPTADPPRVNTTGVVAPEPLADAGNDSSGIPAPAAAPAAALAAAQEPAADANTPAISSQDWTQIQAFKQGLPFTAIGALSMSFAGFGAGCSGSVVGDNVVITAGHCVYDKSSRTAVGSIRFSPFNYYDPAGKQQKPFGTVQAVGHEYLAGRRADGSLKSYVSDMAIVLLKQGVAAQTGILGVAYDRAGYSGKIAAAGYPGMTVSFGRYFRLAGDCEIADGNGENGRLNFKAASQSGCSSGCSISEPGQSGQPAWTQEGDQYYIRAVLSRGPPPGTCKGFDIYTEVNSKHFAWLSERKAWKPT